MDRVVTLAEALGMTEQEPKETASHRRPRSIRALCRAILNSPEYKAHLQRMIVNDEIPPQLEAMLYHYAEGKPVERVEVAEVSATLDDLSAEQLEDRIKRLHERVRQLRTEEFNDEDTSDQVH